MATTISAIYEDGVLRLHAPLPLPEHTPVQITVELPAASPADPRPSIRAALVAAGLSRDQPTVRSALAPLSYEERVALTERVGASRPLSEIIDEERGTR